MNDMNGNPVGVTLLRDPLAKQLKDASQTGSFAVDIQHGHNRRPQGVASADMRTLILPMGIGGTDPQHWKVPFAVVIVNSLPAPLVLAGSAAKKGSQGGYPAIAGFGKHATKEHQIPATFPDPLTPSNKLYGVGAYHFEPDQWNGIGYALSFSYKPNGAGPLVAVAFKYETLWISPISAVTADLSNYKDIGDFFDHLSNSGKTIQYDVGAETTIWATFEKWCLYVWVRDSKSND
jgi:hypothetical protein